MSFRKTVVVSLCLMLLMLTELAHALPTNLLVNGDFESGDQAWTFDLNNQSNVHGEIQNQNYRPGAGLAGAKIIASENLGQYAVIRQDITLDDASELPTEASVWFNGMAGGTLVVYPLDTAKPGVDHVASAPLTSAGDWSETKLQLALPQSTRKIRFELRVQEKGVFAFDDARLIKADVPTKRSQPQGITIIGLRRFWGSQAGGDPMPALMRDALENAGLSPIRSVEWEDVTPASIQSSRAVMVLMYPHRLSLTQHDHAVIDLLKDYVSAGGGLLFGCDRQQQWKDFFIPRAISQTFDLKLLVEDIKPRKEMTWQIGEWHPDTYTFTDAVFPPVNEGVKGILFQAISSWSYRSVVPFVPQDDAWQVVAHSGINASSKPLPPAGLDVLDTAFRDHGFDKNVPLLGVRPFGKGRVAYFAVSMPNIFTRAVPNEQTLDVYKAYVRDGYNDHPSDMLRMITNTFTWLGGNADALQTSQLTIKQVKAEDQFAQGWKLRRGVIGPRTTYSSGKATPDDYVAKAKELGLDFIVFLEDFAQMKRSDFEKLKEDCQRLTTRDFVAVPGITYINGDGNHQYAYSSQLLMPSPALLNEAGDRILCGDESDGIGELRWIYELNSFENQSGWYNFKDNPYPHYDTRDVASMGVITQKGGQTVERVVDDWAYSNFHDQLLWPHALNLATSLDELDAIASGQAYVNVVGTHGVEHLYNVLTTFKGTRARSHNFPGSAPFGATSVSNGPMIQLLAPRADIDTQDGGLYCKQLQTWPLDLTVTSDTGLKEIRLMDGEQIIRRYQPNGKKRFELQNALTLEHQRQIWIHAIDVNGREGFTRALNSNAWIMRELQCGDRNNHLFGSRQYREDGSLYFLGYSTTNCTPTKGPWSPKFRPVGAYTFDKELGLGAVVFDGSPESEPNLWLAPEVWWDGKEPTLTPRSQGGGWLRDLVSGIEGAPHIRAERILASAEVMSADMVLDGVFPLDGRPVIHVWHTLRPVLPAQTIKITQRRTFFLPKVQGITVYKIEQTIEMLKDIPVGEGNNWAVQLGKLGNGHRVKRTARKLGGNPMDTSNDAAEFMFNKGDFVGFYDDPFGSLVVYNLGDPLILTGHPKSYTVRMPAQGKVIPKGTVLKMQLLAVGMHNQTQDPIAMSEAIVEQYGLKSTAKGYQVQLTHGQLLDQQYILNMQAGEYGYVQGTIQGIEKLPGNLPVKIAGFNPNWSVCLQRGGETPGIRFVPIDQDGFANASLQAELDGKPLFIGHPYMADNDKVVLSLVRTADLKQWLLEVHNPTSQTLDVKVQKTQGWRGSAYSKQINLKAGQSHFVMLGSVNGM